MKHCCLLFFVVLLVFSLGCASVERAASTQPKAAADRAQQDRLSPIDGSLLIASGELDAQQRSAFLHLAGGVEARVVVLADASQSQQIVKDMQNLRGEIELVLLEDDQTLLVSERLRPFFNATGVWLARDYSGHKDRALLHDILQSVMARGGVVGAANEGASSIVDTVDASGSNRSPLNLLPGSVVRLGFDGESSQAFDRALSALPSTVGWGIPDGSALVIHTGRRVGVIGDSPVRVSVPKRGDWSSRVQIIEPTPFDAGRSELAYEADLLSWNRSAIDRDGPVFPPAQAPVPSVENGTLLIYGGASTTDEMWDRFIQAAGGKDANFVCIPTASRTDESISDQQSFGYRQLTRRGCTNVQVLHTLSRSRASNDDAFVQALGEADGVWLGGGRTYRMMDAYQHTRVHDLLHQVLERGGAICGSSAGAQVQGDFMLRGDPRNNVEPIAFDGYTTGFGLIRGVIIDAHFSQRGRQTPFSQLMSRYQQMLGIGIDESTGVIVQASVAEVVGDHSVTFYDYAGKAENESVLRAGERYDLKRRAPSPADRAEASSPADSE